MTNACDLATTVSYSSCARCLLSGCGPRNCACHSASRCKAVQTRVQTRRWIARFPGNISAIYINATVTSASIVVFPAVCYWIQNRYVTEVSVLLRPLFTSQDQPMLFTNEATLYGCLLPIVGVCSHNFVRSSQRRCPAIACALYCLDLGEITWLHSVVSVDQSHHSMFIIPPTMLEVVHQ